MFFTLDLGASVELPEVETKDEHMHAPPDEDCVHGLDLGVDEDEVVDREQHPGQDRQQ